MQKKISSALISVYYKEGLEPVVKKLNECGVTIYSTGGTQAFIESLGIATIPVEKITEYPSILGGRVKTLHPMVFGGILAKRDDASHMNDAEKFSIPRIDLVIVDLYPFEETLAATTEHEQIIEKIDIGGPSMLRAAAKNFVDVVVVGSKTEYGNLLKMLQSQDCSTTLDQRRAFAAKAFDICTHYDTAISGYFNSMDLDTPYNKPMRSLRYGENPHQQASFFGNLNELFAQLHGKELSYNNLVDVDAAIQLIREFDAPAFAIIKHTNVCGASIADNVYLGWKLALSGDPESAFGGVLICNRKIDKKTAESINQIFFEVLIAPEFDSAGLKILKTKKNRILLQLKDFPKEAKQMKTVLNGFLVQEADEGNFIDWTEAGGRATTMAENTDLSFANIICKHLKSNAIVLVKNCTVIGKGCGQTSRIDALRQAIDKADQFEQDLSGAVLASDAFFPFDDCVRLAHLAGITAFIQPGGSKRDEDSINYCKENDLAMIITGMRHFKH